jgi:hypothetical protein
MPGQKTLRRRLVQSRLPRSVSRATIYGCLMAEAKRLLSPNSSASNVTGTLHARRAGSPSRFAIKLREALSDDVNDEANH